MMNWIFNIAISTYLTSTLFMIAFYLNAKIGFAREGQKMPPIPFGYFCLVHFCPIVHTIKCFKIMARYAQLKQERGM